MSFCVARVITWTKVLNLIVHEHACVLSLLYEVCRNYIKKVISVQQDVMKYIMLIFGFFKHTFTFSRPSTQKYSAVMQTNWTLVVLDMQQKDTAVIRWRSKRGL